MGRNTKEILWTIREKDLEFLSGMMDDATRATGKMGSRTARALISRRTEESGKGFGKMGNECAGSELAPMGRKIDDSIDC